MDQLNQQGTDDLSRIIQANHESIVEHKDHNRDSLMQAWAKAHPPKQIKERPEKYYTVLYDYIQALNHADGYEETFGPVIVVHCQEDGKYYVIDEV